MEYEWQTITLLMSVSASHSLTQKNRRVIVYMECVYRKYSDLRKIEKESAHYPLFRPLQSSLAASYISVNSISFNMYTYPEDSLFWDVTNDTASHLNPQQHRCITSHRRSLRDIPDLMRDVILQNESVEQNKNSKHPHMLHLRHQTYTYQFCSKSVHPFWPLSCVRLIQFNNFLP
jgi:hypothetical protein